MAYYAWSMCNLYNRLCIERKKFDVPRTSTQMYIDYVRRSLDPTRIVNAPSNESLSETMIVVGQCLLTINWAADALCVFEQLLKESPKITGVYVWMAYACAMMNKYRDTLRYSELFLEMFFPTPLEYALVISGKAKVDVENPYVAWVLTAVALRAYAYRMTANVQCYQYNVAALVHIAIFSGVDYVTAPVDSHVDVVRLFQRDTYMSLVRIAVREYVRLCVLKQREHDNDHTEFTPVFRMTLKGAREWLARNDNNVKQPHAIKTAVI